MAINIVVWVYYVLYLHEFFVWYGIVGFNVPLDGSAAS